jgi:hypothetical protein
MNGVEIARDLGIAVSVTLLIGAAFSGWRWGRPWLKQFIHEQKSMREVLLGRDEIPANKITGAEAVPAVKPLGQQVAEMAALLLEVHHEVHPNTGTSMADAVTRIEHRLENGDGRFSEIEKRLDAVEGAA